MGQHPGTCSLVTYYESFLFLVTFYEDNLSLYFENLKSVALQCRIYPQEFPFVSLKGIVQRKLRWVEIDINRLVLL
jgi:hypothetical protein